MDQYLHSGDGHGHDITNTSTSTIHLPSSPNIGRIPSNPNAEQLRATHRAAQLPSMTGSASTGAQSPDTVTESPVSSPSPASTSSRSALQHVTLRVRVLAMGENGHYDPVIRIEEDGRTGADGDTSQARRRRREPTPSPPVSSQHRRVFADFVAPR